MSGLIQAIIYVDPKSITEEEIVKCGTIRLNPDTGLIAAKRIFDHVLGVTALETKDVFTCKKHGSVDGFFRVYGKEFCGKCAAEAIEKFIKEMA